MQVLDANFADDANGVSDVENPVTFTGRSLDLDTGLYHFRNRDYGAEIGRFCQRDPIGYADGLNLYAGYFVPGAVDPSGLLRVNCKCDGYFDIVIDHSLIAIVGDYESADTACRNLCTRNGYGYNNGDWEPEGAPDVLDRVADSRFITRYQTQMAVSAAQTPVNMVADTCSAIYNYDDTLAALEFLLDNPATAIQLLGEDLYNQLSTPEGQGQAFTEAALGALSPAQLAKLAAILKKLPNGRCLRNADDLPVLQFDYNTHPDLADNIWNAQQAGHPDVLTYGPPGINDINRPGATSGIPNIPGTQIDEYPFASTLEGGPGSWVGHIPPAQNSSQGGILSQFYDQLQPGDRFRVEIQNHPRAK